MAQLRIPYPAGASGPVALKITLVDAAGTPVPAFQQQALRHVAVRYDMTADAIVELVPSAQLGLPGGFPSYYAVEIATSRFTARYQVEVLDTEQIQELADRAAAAPLAIGPAGPAGPAGPPGLRGPAGPAGADGADGDMQALIYDPRGVRADSFAAENLAGVFDGGVF